MDVREMSQSGVSVKRKESVCHVNCNTLCKTSSNLKYLLDSLFYLAGSRAPYIHVILSYVVSIT